MGLEIWLESKNFQCHLSFSFYCLLSTLVPNGTGLLLVSPYLVQFLSSSDKRQSSEIVNVEITQCRTRLQTHTRKFLSTVGEKFSHDGLDPNLLGNGYAIDC